MCIWEWWCLALAEELEFRLEAAGEPLGLERFVWLKFVRIVTAHMLEGYINAYQSIVIL